jgi:hypothetical protein
MYFRISSTITDSRLISSYILDCTITSSLKNICPGIRMKIKVNILVIGLASHEVLTQ